MKSRRHDTPPPLAEALLGWLLKDAWQTPLGDFEEFYHELATVRGARRARWWYRGQVLRLLPDRLYEKTYWHTIMLQNYFTSAYRTLLKNKVASFINLFGLSVAVACSIVVYVFLQNYLTIDRFHENGETIFLVEHTVEQDNELQTWGTSPMPLGPVLAATFPEIERSVRLNSRGGLVQYEGGIFEERIVFADEGFFDMFTFPLAYGSPAALSDPSAVILSREMAYKYFGQEPALGKQLTFSFGNDHTETFTVQGVAEAFPDNRGFYFNFLINYDKQRDLGGERLDDWAVFTSATFIQVRAPKEMEALAARMTPYVALQNAANEEWTVQSFLFDNLRHPASDAYMVQGRVAEAAHPGFILMLLAIPLVMLALSCFNYVNISLGASVRRLREIGVRKVMGSTKMQLVLQFMAENLLLCFLSLLLGLGIAWGFLVPLFNGVFVNQITLSLTENLGLWFFLVGLLAVVGFASGAYPAFYIASFQPVVIFRGNYTLARKQWFTRAFLTVQFVLAFITVISGVYTTLNGRYLLRQDWGYPADQTLVVRINGSDQFTRLRNEIHQHPNVVEVAGSEHHVGESLGGAVVDIEGVKKNMRYYGVGPRYFEALGLRLASGRFFDEHLNVDAASDAVINRAFAEAEGWTEPIGQTLRVDGTIYTVVGVVEDFLMHPMLRDRPIFFLPSGEQPYQYLSIRLQAGTAAATAAALEPVWKRLFPDAPFSFFFQDDVFDIHYQSYANLAEAFSYIAALALLISCMGLFGLASQNIARRLKEVSIRKVLGASVPSVALLVNRGFLTMLAVAAAIASPVCYFGLTALFTAFDARALHLPMGPDLFIFSYTLIFVTAALSVAMQARTLVTANPADVLRGE